jgi:transposase InsO family protein
MGSEAAGTAGRQAPRFCRLSRASPHRHATKRLITARVMWRSLNSDVAAWVKNCQQCERAKVSRQHTAAVQPIAIPARRFIHIHVDIVGPLPAATCDSRYLFTVVDSSSRWLEAPPMRDIAAASCADALIVGWISRYGVPVQLTSDRGTQFTSAIWDALCQQLGIQHQQTTAFHPQANGMVERCHRRLKDALRALLAGPDWPLHLPWVLMGLRAAPTEDTGVSAAEIVFRLPLVLPGQILDTEEPLPADFITRLRQFGPPPPSRPFSYGQMAAKPLAALLSAAFVNIRKGGMVPPLSPLYSGPYKVLASGPKVFRLQVGEREETVSIDRLKPHRGAAPVQPAQLPARGRPPAG